MAKIVIEIIYTRSLLDVRRFKFKIVRHEKEGCSVGLLDELRYGASVT
jgi:hypothetical protein